jgi:hypothetical protein
MGQLKISWATDYTSPVLKRLTEEMNQHNLREGFDFDFIESERADIRYALNQQRLAHEEIGHYYDNKTGVKIMTFSIALNRGLLNRREKNR